MKVTRETVVIGKLTSFKEIKGSEHSYYAIVSCIGLDSSITFTKSLQVWQETDWPEPGDYVALSMIKFRDSGPRACRARFATSDEITVYEDIGNVL